MKKIEMDKKYKTKSGLEVRILDTKFESPYSNQAVVAAIKNKADGMENLMFYSIFGKFNGEGGAESHYDLVEVNFWDDWKIDDLVCVRDSSDDDWQLAHFAGVKNGDVYVWSLGASSATVELCFDNNNRIAQTYTYTILATEKDINTVRKSNIKIFEDM